MTASGRTLPFGSKGGKVLTDATTICGNLASRNEKMRLSIGIDFGTTNTVVALARRAEKPRAVLFRGDSELSGIYRSVLCFEHLSASRHDVAASAGRKAIHSY